MRNFRLCFPPMEPQVFCMHSKLLLMFHPGYLRIFPASGTSSLGRSIRNTVCTQLENSRTSGRRSHVRLMENVRDYAYRMSLSFLTVYRLYFLLTSPDLKFGGSEIGGGDCDAKISRVKHQKQLRMHAENLRLHGWHYDLE
jgi:hypothetical protein